MALTDTAIRKAKPADKPQKLTDGGGLYLLLNPNGSRWWRWDYRFAGKRKTLSMGTYPDTGLADAREKHAAARKLLAVGVDPGIQRKAERAAGAESGATSFAAIAEEWFATRHDLADTTRNKIRWMLDDLALPWIGARQIGELEPPDVLAVLRRVESRGHLETAQRLKSICSLVFRYAVATGRAKRDPTSDLRGALKTPKTRHHASITDPAEVGELLRAVEGFRGTFSVLCALRLAPLVFVRPGELRKAEWSEFDLDEGMWVIPAERMKMREKHFVPLSKQAVAILRDLQALTGRHKLVFPGGRRPTEPMSENAVTAALRRLGYDGDTMTGHGFRSMASTLLHERGYNPDWIERQLAHAERNRVRAAYNYAQHLPERKRMMQEWADYLDNLRSGAKIVPFERQLA
jgi:integrase